MNLHTRSTFIAMIDNAMEHLIVSYSLLVISPSPYFCFVRAKTLSTASCQRYLCIPSFCQALHFSLVCQGMVQTSGFRVPCNKQGCFYFGR